MARSVRAGEPNAMDGTPLKYIVDPFDNCIWHLLLMPTPMQTFIHIRLYRKMFAAFARHELASSPIRTLDDLIGSWTHCFAHLDFA